MVFVKRFEDINKNNVSIAGGKGASLGEMTQAGIPVPSGFVILSNAFEGFIKENNLNIEIDAALDEIKHKEVHTIEEASKKIKSLIINSELPKDVSKGVVNSFKKLNSKFVAVRSSATSEDSVGESWAGQLESYLNTTEKDLLENVKKCWASLFSPKALFYRFKKRLKNISIAVVIQKMIESEKSGVVFSVHPVTENKNQLIIEAGFGLGEAIVFGKKVSSSYLVDKRNFDIKNKEGEKQVLDDKELIELTKLIVKIENHYGFPVDVEWAKEKNTFHIIQSRPITTIKK